MTEIYRNSSIDDIKVKFNCFGLNKDADILEKAIYDYCTIYIKLNNIIFVIILFYV